MADRGELLKIEGLELPELEKHGGAIHFYPNLNAGEFLYMMSKLNGEKTDLEAEAWPELITKLARDENGKRIWGSAHAQKILEWDAADLVTVINGLAPAIEHLAETLKKS